MTYLATQTYLKVSIICIIGSFIVNNITDASKTNYSSLHFCASRTLII